MTKAKIRKNAVTQAKIGRDAVTGAKVREATLGTVPSATEAGSALSAQIAQSAVGAVTAQVAGNAASLNGQTAAQIVAAAGPDCPAGMEFEVGLCVEPTARSALDYFSSLNECRSDGLRLPSQGELIAYESQTFGAEEPPPYEWVEPSFYDGAVTRANTMRANEAGYTVVTDESGEINPYRCVTPPS